MWDLNQTPALAKSSSVCAAGMAHLHRAGDLLRAAEANSAQVASRKRARTPFNEKLSTASRAIKTIEKLSI